ncbi:hypothetical protein J6590_009708 [Homalodisca vitripennis]|nr:hypothetical protein J6590_009708 [Homalodisca vitripennis]
MHFGAQIYTISGTKFSILTQFSAKRRPPKKINVLDKTWGRECEVVSLSNAPYHPLLSRQEAWSKRGRVRVREPPAMYALRGLSIIKITLDQLAQQNSGESFILGRLQAANRTAKTEQHVRDQAAAARSPHCSWPTVLCVLGSRTFGSN